MTKNKAQKSAIRQRMAETGEPYSVARHAVEASQPAAAEGWDEEYYADGAASEGITVAEFKAREAAGNRPPEVPIADAQAAGGPVTPSLGEAALAGGRLASEPRRQWQGDAPGMPPMPPVPPCRQCRPCHRDSPGRPGERPGAGRYSSPRMRSASSARSCRRRRPRRTRPRRRRPRRRSGPPGCRNRPAGRGSEPAGRGSELAGPGNELAGSENGLSGRGSEPAGRRKEPTGRRTGQAGKSGKALTRYRSALT